MEYYEMKLLSFCPIFCWIIYSKVDSVWNRSRVAFNHPIQGMEGLIGRLLKRYDDLIANLLSGHLEPDLLFPYPAFLGVIGHFPAGGTDLRLFLTGQVAWQAHCNGV